MAEDPDVCNKRIHFEEWYIIPKINSSHSKHSEFQNILSQTGFWVIFLTPIMELDFISRKKGIEKAPYLMHQEEETHIFDSCHDDLVEDKNE